MAVKTLKNPYRLQTVRFKPLAGDIKKDSLQLQLRIMVPKFKFGWEIICYNFIHIEVRSKDNITLTVFWRGRTSTKFEFHVMKIQVYSIDGDQGSQ